MSTPISLTSYLPPIEEIPLERILDARARLEADLKLDAPGLDVRPNSVFGDQILKPFAEKLAGYEIAAERFASDFDLEQIAQNIIYDCDRVRAFLRNFAAVERENLKATGTVRLTFSSAAASTLDRRTLFLFGTSSLFSLRLAGSGGLIIRAPGSERTGLNDVVLAQVDTDRWVVDVPVVGVMPEAVSDGDTASTDNLPANLVSMTAVGDFDDGAPEDSLPVLAKRTRETFYSSSLCTRTGAAAFVRKEFTGITGVSAVISGDTEMLRDTTNALGLRDGRLDVHVKSKQAYLTTTQLVKLTFDVAEDKFVGRLNLSQIPIKIDSVVAQAAPTETLTKTILSQSADPVRAPLATCAYSSLEKLWLVVDMPRDEDELPLIPTQSDDDGAFAYFLVTFRFDPGVQQVAAVLDSPEVRPVGVDVLTRLFVPCVFTQLIVEYVKPAGKQVNVTAARAEIMDYFLRLNHPEIHVDSAISDALIYNGASGVRSLSCLARLQWTVADKILPDDAGDPVDDVAAALAAALTPPALDIVNTATLVPEYRDPHLGTALATLVASGKRNISYLLDEAALSFTEFLP